MKRLSILIIVIAVAGGIFLYLRSYKKPDIVWTRENSLTKVPCVFSDVLLTKEILSDAITQNISGLKKIKADLQYGSTKVSREAAISSLSQFAEFLAKKVSSDEIRQFMQDEFDCFSSAAESVLFTGYYIPQLQGSFVKSDRYRFPLYKKPPDLIPIEFDNELEKRFPKELPIMNRGRMDNGTVHIPYFSRRQIDYENKLSGKNLELMWVDDDVDLFFMQIQGSGSIQLPDGKSTYAGYADKNGNPYRAIGKVMIDRGLVSKENVSMFALKQKLREREDLKAEILASNPSYVFFRILDTKPVGSFGVPLTGKYSIATDTKLFPQGSLALITIGSIPSQLVLNQDTGGAIRGPGRVDYFCGEGKEAEQEASGLKRLGSLVFLAPKSTE